MITAASNSRIKRLVQLNQKSKLRRTEDVFLAEGVKMFLEAPREQLQEAYVSESGNLGTMLRTGEGAGVSGIIMSRDTVDLYNPKVIRSTMGSIYRVPFYYADDFAAAVHQVQQAGVSVYAAHLRGKNSYACQDYTKGTAFLIGNEGNGLREETAELADCYIRIPMEGKVESLNAAVASSILMYEAHRQRATIEK